ncbi:MAG TPA: DUF5615 family PIN-like protein [Flavipsychrobacter sp.]|nr:DUF5615 family PIN-like protein [Flavipsychrobacter sp.]
MQLDWELWLDHNFSPIIAKWLKEETGWTVKSSYILGFNAASDLDIYAKARAKGNVIIISKDSDFAEILAVRGSPPKLINIKTGNSSNKAMFEFLKSNLPKAIRIITSFNINVYELE